MRRSPLPRMFLVIALAVIAILGLQAQGLKVKPQAARKIPANVFVPAKYTLKILFVRLADDDGSKPSTLTKAQAQAAVDSTNLIFRMNRGDIRFELAPESDFVGFVKNTTMNHDCLLKPGWTEAKIAAQTTQDVNGDGAADWSDYTAMCDPAPATAARNGYALLRPNRLVVYSRGSSEYVKWEDTHYVLKYASGGHSGGGLLYVAMPASFGGGTLLAHELGHYFHLPHTFGSSSYVPATMADAYAKIFAWVATHPAGHPLGCFDGDGRDVPAIADTPPDAGGGVFVEAYGDKCDADKGSIPFVVKAGGVQKTYDLTPDRANIMSYFKSCPWQQHFSRNQYAIMDASLATGNRQPLTVGDPYENPCFASARPEQSSQKDPMATLRDVLRKAATCHLLTRRPWRWEMVAGIYSTPERASRTMIRDAANPKLFLDPGRERSLITALSDARNISFEF